MARLIRTIKTRSAPFYRCGTRFTREGALFEDDAFTSAEWSRLMTEPMLEIEPVAADAPPPPDAEVTEALVAAIAALPEDAFTKGGAPKLAALREALPGLSDRIDDHARDAAWAAFQAQRDTPGAPPAT